MLAIRYKKEMAEEETFLDMSQSQYEMITDEDIFEMMGKRGVCLEFRKMINLFQSEEEFVESMSRALCDGEAEIYMQDSFDEFDNNDNNDVYIVIACTDIARLLEVSVSEVSKAIYSVAMVLEESLDVIIDRLETISPTNVLYMICVALIFRKKYTSNNVNIILDAMELLFERYYGNNDRLPDGTRKDWEGVICKLPVIGTEWWMKDFQCGKM